MIQGRSNAFVVFFFFFLGIVDFKLRHFKYIDIETLNLRKLNV